MPRGYSPGNKHTRLVLEAKLKQGVIQHAGLNNQRSLGLSPSNFVYEKPERKNGNTCILINIYSIEFHQTTYWKNLFSLGCKV